MSYPRPLELELLDHAETLIENALGTVRPSGKPRARFQILETAAAQIGGFPVSTLRHANDRQEPDYLAPIADVPGLLLHALSKTGIHPSLCLAILSRPHLYAMERRSQGAYHTDFRLAQYLALHLQKRTQANFRLIDPACGTGILLVASALHLSGNSKRLRDHLLAETLCGMDLSPLALRGARLALASLTSDVCVIKSLSSRLRQGDSLLSGLDIWKDIAPDGFEVVVGNPPWEKLRLTRHEWLKANGIKRHYGDAYAAGSLLNGMHVRRNEMSLYMSTLQSKYKLQGDGERDLYKLFLELSLCIGRPGGEVALLLPGGFIRSQGTTALRASTFGSCSRVSLTVFDNKARFFQIDSRFKFLLFSGSLQNGHPDRGISLSFASSNGHRMHAETSVVMPRSILTRLRPDLSIPEVRTSSEWKLFLHFARRGRLLRDPDGPWQPKFMREVDMTQDKPRFLPKPAKGAVPVIEGRMVHQYQFSAKRYVSGTGRRALWLPNGKDVEEIHPQFYISAEKLLPQVQDRCRLNRAGFCDITGQTNERTMLASRIPSGVVCGNKVPTLLFNGDPRNQQLYIDSWLAIVNSIPFDWLLRRVATTSVNYFLLLDLPMPPIQPNSKKGAKLAHLSEQLSLGRIADAWGRAEIRAEIDWRVLSAFGCDVKVMELLLEDFPLLDRSQPALQGEPRSTITKDLLLARAAQHLGGVSRSRMDFWRERVARAKSVGAVAYIPSHLAASMRD